MLRRLLIGGFVIIGVAAAGAALAAPKGKGKDKDKPPDKPLSEVDPAFTECKVPFRPATSVNGATATAEQMTAFYDAVRGYQAQLAVYRLCLTKKIETAKTADDRVQLAALNQFHNASVDAEEQVVSAFNVALRASGSAGANKGGAVAQGTKTGQKAAAKGKGPSIDEADSARYQRCLAQITLNSGAAIEAALEWMGEGGGAPARHCHAAALIANGHPDEGAQRLEALAKARGDYGNELRAEMLGQAGNAWLVAGKPDRAADDFRAALDLAQKAKLAPAVRANALADLARAQMIGGDIKAARAALDQSIALKASAEALVTRARLAREARDLKTARADISRALALEPKYPEGLLERGRLHLATGDTKAARQDFLDASLGAKTGPIADAAQHELEALDIR